MHFIFGGAYNGKTAYAKTVAPEATIYTAYIPSVHDVHTETVIVRHLEQCITQCDNERTEAARIVEQLTTLAAHCTLIVIGTDISRGVVPMEKEARFQRDCAGRLYQLLMQQATTVTQVWYGIPQLLKGV